MTHFDGSRVEIPLEKLADFTSEAGNPRNVNNVEVVDVDQQSPAFRAGLRPGDVIYEVNRSSVANLRDFNEIVSEPAAVTALSVIRENRRMLVILS